MSSQAPVSEVTAPRDGRQNDTPRSEIDRLFRLQRANRQPLRMTSAEQRREKLRALRDMVLSHRKQIQDALFADFRKPPSETDVSETAAVATEAAHAAKHVKEWMAPKRVGTPAQLAGTASEIRYEPKGQSLIIAPWNFPVNLSLSPIVAALAAGCSVILKPSEHTPFTSRLLREMLHATFDEREVAVVEGAVETSQYLLAKPFDHIFFTGSTHVGKIVMRAAAEHLSSVTLELGGKSPVIVDETADVKKAAKRIALGKFINCGQTCIAPDHVYVHRSRHDDLVEALDATIASFYGGTPEDRMQSMDYARVVNPSHHERLQGLLDDALARGAQVAAGSGDAGDGNYLDPTVLTNVPEDAAIMQEEIFGPLLPILRYDDLREVVSAINDRPKPLALYVFSRSDTSVEYVLNHTSAGGSTINNVFLHNLNPELPFGGVNASGIGSYHGYYGFREFSHERAIVRQRRLPSPLDMVSPPYTGFTRRAVDAALKLV